MGYGCYVLVLARRWVDIGGIGESGFEVDVLVGVLF